MNSVTFLYLLWNLKMVEELLSVELFEVIIQKRTIHHWWWVKCQTAVAGHPWDFYGTWDAHDSNWNVSFPRPAKQGGNPSLPNICKSHFYNTTKVPPAPKSKGKEFANSIADVQKADKITSRVIKHICNHLLNAAHRVHTFPLATTRINRKFRHKM